MFNYVTFEQDSYFKNSDNWNDNAIMFKFSRAEFSPT